MEIVHISFSALLAGPVLLRSFRTWPEPRDMTVARKRAILAGQEALFLTTYRIPFFGLQSMKCHTCYSPSGRGPRTNLKSLTNMYHDNVDRAVHSRFDLKLTYHSLSPWPVNLIIGFRERKVLNNPSSMSMWNCRRKVPYVVTT